MSSHSVSLLTTVSRCLWAVIAATCVVVLMLLAAAFSMAATLIHFLLSVPVLIKAAWQDWRFNVSRGSGDSYTFPAALWLQVRMWWLEVND